MWKQLTCAVIIVVCLQSCMSVVAHRPIEVRQQTAVEVLEVDGETAQTAQPVEDDPVATDSAATDTAATDTAAPVAEDEESLPDHMYVETNLGQIVIALDAEAAPNTVVNVKRYAHDGFYNGTVFHRVIANFMIQGGGFAADSATEQFIRKPTRDPIKNEGGNGLRNVRGSVAMARTNNPHSATSQFYINVVDNTHLDSRAEQIGYCVFGHVVSGMDVVDKIAAVQTTRSNWPVTPIVMKSVRIPKSALQTPVEDAGGPQRPAQAAPAKPEIEQPVETAVAKDSDYFAQVTSFSNGVPAVINISAGSDDGLQKGDVLVVQAARQSCLHSQRYTSGE